MDKFWETKVWRNASYQFLLHKLLQEVQSLLTGNEISMAPARQQILQGIPFCRKLFQDNYYSKTRYQREISKHYKAEYREEAFLRRVLNVSSPSLHIHFPCRILIP